MPDNTPALETYATCPIERFETAMRMARRDVDPVDIPDAELYVLYTKYRADAAQCAGTKTSYALGIGITSQRRADAYKRELGRRGIPT